MRSAMRQAMSLALVLLSALSSSAALRGKGALRGDGPLRGKGPPLRGEDPLARPCTFNSASAPTCWGEYDLSTNYYKEWPDTGVVREYWFEITNTTAAPDGVERLALVINGQVPGPTIIADWGDTVVVHLKNSLQNNGTSIHFHGIRQWLTNGEDGVGSITQCPTAPGDSVTYTWRATQYGSSWYHSHFSLQAWNGVYGGIIINGPASSSYDEDLGFLSLDDWFHRTPDSLYAEASSVGPPVADNGLINGTNVYGFLGSRFETTFVSGKSYRLRITNSALNTHFKFMVDNHTMTVIANDLVPIHPYKTKVLSISMGQRYDVIVKANQLGGNFWMRAIPQETCSDNHNANNIRGIVRYKNSTSGGDPTSTGWSYVDNCDDEPMSSLVPYLALNVAAQDIEETVDINRTIIDDWYKWTVNKQSFLVDWGYPTVQQTLDGNMTFSPRQNVVMLDGVDQTVYFVLEGRDRDPHPIHLHGHDTWVLAQGNGAFDDSVVLQTRNPPRRDTVMLPARGHLVLAFETDNPGIWLMHCHIGWHLSQGFALQLIERVGEIASILDADDIADTCSKWHAYQEAFHVNQHEHEESGV